MMDEWDLREQWEFCKKTNDFDSFVIGMIKIVSASKEKITQLEIELKKHKEKALSDKECVWKWISDSSK